MTVFSSSIYCCQAIKLVVVLKEHKHAICPLGQVVSGVFFLFIVLFNNVSGLDRVVFRKFSAVFGFGQLLTPEYTRCNYPNPLEIELNQTYSNSVEQMGSIIEQDQTRAFGYATRGIYHISPRDRSITLAKALLFVYVIAWAE